MLYIVEYLTVRTWFQSVLPHLLRTRAGQGANRRRGFVLEASRAGMAAARVFQWLSGVSMDQLQFRLIDVRDEQGRLIRLRVLYQDLAEVQPEIMADIHEALGPIEDAPRVQMYLAKALATCTTSLNDRQTLWRALLTIQVCVWTARQTGEQEVCYFLERRPWFRAVRAYAARAGVHLVPIVSTFCWRTRVRRALPLAWVERLRDWHSWILSVKRRIRSTDRVRGTKTVAAGDTRAHLAVEYYGHLNLDHPERHSNLFFWPRSGLRGRDLLVLFGLPTDPLDAAKWEELSRHDIRGLVTHAGAAGMKGLPGYLRHERPRNIWMPARGERRRVSGTERDWLRTQLHNYRVLRDYWTGLFASQRIKVFVSWFKYSEVHCAVADALQSLGGITAVYQRSYEMQPSAETAAAVDVLFGFSSQGAELERRSGSVIPYYITTGYLSDYGFPLWKVRAAALRQQLMQRGARHILSFCDENSHEGRWMLGHGVTRSNYAFFLQKVLEEPWFGFVIKPKMAATLRRRLGPVASLLEQAEATGRCFVFEGGVLHGSFPPAAAALASDLMVHGHLPAATAGVESALAGTPTVFLDHEGWPGGPFYGAGKGRLVFTDLEQFWSACLEHWTCEGGVPGFGDWSELLPELDPFRDGRAAERMGTFLRWLIEGFQAGRNREAVLSDAAQRYAEQWGQETVIEVKPDASRWPRVHTPVSLATVEAVSS